MSKFLTNRKSRTASREEMSLEQYLDQCKTNPLMYATAAERMLAAIGEPNIVNTMDDRRLSLLFSNRTIKIYDCFKDFYGMEDTIEKIVNYFKFASQNLEERKQILYLLGPVGGGKSSLAEKLKDLMEVNPIYVLKYREEISPIFESPLNLFDTNEADMIMREYNIPTRYVKGLRSPWAVKRLRECGGDITQFSVVKLYPSEIEQIGIAKVEPGDENNQDISTIVGKLNLRKLETFDAKDTDAYSYSGGLNITTQGMMEFVEMFKAPIKMLHPLLTATQEGNYIGTENIGAIPFNGVILAHSNEVEWTSFKNNKNNEAFIDRVYLVHVPYCLRVSEEASILQKLLTSSSLVESPCAPDTLKMLARFNVLSRIKSVPGGLQSTWSKMRVYDGESLKDEDPNAKSLHEYKEQSGIDEGMSGPISTRFAYKVLAATFNHDPHEIAADPIHLMNVLLRYIEKEQFAPETEKELKQIIQVLASKYSKFIGEEIQQAYLESYDEYGQNVFENYISWADAWIDETIFRDPDTQQVYNREELDKKLSEIEGPSNIANKKDFRNEIVKFAIKHQAANGSYPRWSEYAKIRDVIKKKMFSQVEDLLPIISFGAKKDNETTKKHADFVSRMMTRGYTERQVRRVVDWYMRVKQSS